MVFAASTLAACAHRGVYPRGGPTHLPHTCELLRASVLGGGGECNNLAC